jgi:hypothetical protein
MLYSFHHYALKSEYVYGLDADCTAVFVQHGEVGAINTM